MKGVEESRHDTESALYQQQIEQYISTYLSQGYTPEQLEDYLVGKGFGAESVRKALKKINRVRYKGELELPTKKNSMHLLLSILFILLILSAGVFYYFQNNEAYKFLVSIENQDLVKGDSLHFLIGTTKTVEVQFRILDGDERMVVQRNEIFDMSQTYVLNLPRAMGEGTYVVDLYVDYNGEKDHKSFSFTLGPADESKNKVPVIFEEGERLSTTPTIEIPREPTSLDEFTKAISQEDETLCSSIEDVDLEEECYFVIARDTQNEEICQEITTSHKKDNCLLTQKLAGKDISCDAFDTAQGANTCSQLS